MSDKKLTPGQFDAIMCVFGKLILRTNSSDAKKILDNLVEIEIEQDDFESRNGIDFCSCPDCASDEANQENNQIVSDRSSKSLGKFADEIKKTLRNSNRQSLKKRKKFLNKKNKFYPDKIMARKRFFDTNNIRWDKEFSIFELLDSKNKQNGNFGPLSKSIKDGQYRAWKKDLLERRNQQDGDSQTRQDKTSRKLKKFRETQVDLMDKSSMDDEFRLHD